MSQTVLDMGDMGDTKKSRPTLLRSYVVMGKTGFPPPIVPLAEHLHAGHNYTTVYSPDDSGHSWGINASLFLSLCLPEEEVGGKKHTTNIVFVPK